MQQLRSQLIDSVTAIRNRGRRPFPKKKLKQQNKLHVSLISPTQWILEVLYWLTAEWLFFKDQYFQTVPVQSAQLVSESFTPSAS